MTGKRMSGKYIQTVFVKYTFPVDDEPLESDQLTYPDESSDQFTYGVQMHSSHAYLLGKEEQISKLLYRSGDFFNIQLCCLKDNLEVTLGNSQIPLEDV